MCTIYPWPQDTEEEAPAARPAFTSGMGREPPGFNCGIDLRLNRHLNKEDMQPEARETEMPTNLPRDA